MILVSEQWWRHFNSYFCEAFQKSINSTQSLWPRFALSLRPLHYLQSDWLLPQSLRTVSFKNQNSVQANYLSVQSVQNSWCRPTAVEVRWSIQRRPAWPKTQTLRRAAASKANILCESSRVCNSCQSVCADLRAVSDTAHVLRVGLCAASIRWDRRQRHRGCERSICVGAALTADLPEYWWQMDFNTYKPIHLLADGEQLCCVWDRVG